MLQRVLEPEVMDSADEAKAYDAMDHVAVNTRFCDDLLALRPAPARVLDVGTGTARIPIELCQRAPSCKVVATDLARHMLSRARHNVEAAGLGERIELRHVDAKASGLPARAFDVVMSNSIVHHIPDPSAAIADMIARVAPAGLLFVRDLMRPVDDAAVHALVSTYARDEAPDARALFEASLRAALTVDELIAMLAPLGVPARSIGATSDRHWTIAWRAP